MLNAKNQDRLKHLFHAGHFLMVVTGSVGLWQVRNVSQAGYSGFSAIADVNVYFYQGGRTPTADSGIRSCL